MGYNRRRDPDAWWRGEADTPEFAELARKATWASRWFEFARILVFGVALLGLAVWSWLSIRPKGGSERLRQTLAEGRDTMVAAFVAGGAFFLLIAFALGWWLVRKLRHERDGKWG